ncbi:MFS transporter [Nibricoccus aquaticus]|uniref:MFS transporter n=1 Tax=Nibricoccus aquaticus TaxID=2576891 RepID=UPI001586684C|nr:MFS transporter [Nibricoccus aquaticus]
MKPDADSSATTNTASPAGAPSAQAIRAEDRVGWGEKMALGAGGLSLFLGTAAIGSFAIPFYQMTLKLDPAWLAAALAIPRFLDAFVDPLVGQFSDNLQSRFGRRRPLIAIGAVLQALAFGLIWMVPPTWDQLSLTAWLVVTQVIFYAGFSLYSVPLTALQYEITPDYDERTRVSAVSGFFGKVGELGYNWLFPLASSAALFATIVVGVRTVGWGVAILLLGLCGLLPALFVRERFFHRAAEQAKVKIGSAIWSAFRIRAFQILVALTLLQIVAGMFASNLDRYLLVYYMSDGNVQAGETLKAWLSSSYAIVGFAAILPVTWAAQKWGKRRAIIAAFLLTAVGAAGKWFLFTPGHTWKIIFDAMLCGPVWIAINILTPAMLADICDEDELRNGFRREGVFGAIFSWIQKMGYSAAFFGAMLSLKLTGFDAALGGQQAPETIFRLRTILAGSTALWAVVAIALLMTYPLDRKRAHETRAQLEARRGAV